MGELPGIRGAWGLLGPDALSTSRRTRTLGLGASVRSFNDLAVPGLGGVWYGKQLLLATLGVAVAQQAQEQGARARNVNTANAIEALACLLAFEGNRWNRDSRLRGHTKLKSKGDDFTFSRFQRRGFYVTQPMRMATVQALPALGFVETDSTRFNTFRCSEAGNSFIDRACADYKPSNRSVLEHLVRWVRGERMPNMKGPLGSALSPLVPLSREARALLRERLLQGTRADRQDNHRRRDALSWAERLRNGEPPKRTWKAKPKEVTDEHWLDLVAGAKFFRVHEVAIEALDALEEYIGGRAIGLSYPLKTVLPHKLLRPLDALRSAAESFLATGHTDKEAVTFCKMCTSLAPSDVLRSLVQRDGRVLRLVGDEVRPGPAFRGLLPAASEGETETDDSPTTAELPLPEGISYRVRNLYLLNLDMHNKLDKHLNVDE